MPYQILQGSKVPVKVFVDDLSKVESEALNQLRNVANLPWVLGVSAMPDCHYGKGATVGSVIVQKEALSPTVVGVDIGCGAIATKTPFSLSDFDNKSLKILRDQIEASVPVGFKSNETLTNRAATSFLNIGVPSERAEKFLSNAALQLGSLGGGNHFIEICTDKENNIWIMLHSGSRNIGKELADYHINKAKGLMGELVKKFGEMIIDPDLAALVVGTSAYDDYIRDLFFCQKYASANREEMMLRVLRQLSLFVLNEDVGPTKLTKLKVSCHHNYISAEDTPLGYALVTRKGAVSAKIGELGIIPGSMGQKSYIVKGLGNAESYSSCSHGAGRRMSRGKAKKVFTLEDMEIQTLGVECRKDMGVLDEIPGAYKDIDEVMNNQKDCVEVVAELKQILCVKG